MNWKNLSERIEQWLPRDQAKEVCIITSEGMFYLHDVRFFEEHGQFLGCAMTFPPTEPPSPPRIMDDTEPVRKQMLEQLTQNPSTREELERAFGQVWTTEELTQEFTVEQFLAPYVIVRKKQDGTLGSLLFQPKPRFYFSWEKHE